MSSPPQGGPPETGVAPYVPPVRRLPLFVYGSLTDPAFVANLLEHPVKLEGAALLGHHRVEFEGFDYPFVIPHEGGRVAGQLLLDLSPSDYERLDSYEGVNEGLYQRVEAQAQLVSGDVCEAYVYAATDKTLDRYG